MSKRLTLLMSQQALSTFGARIETILAGHDYQLLDLGTHAEANGKYPVNVAFLSRDVTADSGKTTLAPALERFYEIIRHSPALQWFQTHSAGTDRPIYREIMNRGVTVTTASGANAVPVAQMAFAGILALSRRLSTLMDSQSRKAWEPLLGPNAPRDLSTQTALIVGWGPIGQEVARLCKCIGMSVVAVRRHVESCTLADEVITFADLPKYLPTTDWVVLACPLNETTRGLINAKALASMPSGSHIVNVARGEVIVQDDLIAAVISGHLGGAFLDVFEKEPLPFDSRLWELPNVIVSPHTAGHTLGHYEEVGKIFLDNLQRWKIAAELRNQVQ